NEKISPLLRLKKNAVNCGIREVRFSHLVLNVLEELQGSLRELSAFLHGPQKGGFLKVDRMNSSLPEFCRSCTHDLLQQTPTESHFLRLLPQFLILLLLELFALNKKASQVLQEKFFPIFEPVVSLLHTRVSIFQVLESYIAENLGQGID